MTCLYRVIGTQGLRSLLDTAGEDYQSICGDHYIGRSLESMQRAAGRRNFSGVTRYCGIDPIIVDVTVEYFAPRPGIGKSNRVVVPCCFGESRNYDYVVSGPIKPSVKGHDAVLVVDMEGVYVFAAQSRLIPA